jgi:hypothetical protein
MIKYVTIMLIAASGIATSAKAEETVHTLALSYVSCMGHHAALAEGLDLQIGFKPPSKEDLTQEFTELSTLNGAPNAEELAAAFEHAYTEAKTMNKVTTAFSLSGPCNDTISRVRAGDLENLAMKSE